jgi:hypothetical protein
MNETRYKMFSRKSFQHGLNGEAIRSGTKNELQGFKGHEDASSGLVKPLKGEFGTENHMKRTLPKIVLVLSSSGVLSSVMKNCDPFLLRSKLAHPISPRCDHLSRL